MGGGTGTLGVGRPQTQSELLRNSSLRVPCRGQDIDSSPHTPQRTGRGLGYGTLCTPVAWGSPALHKVCWGVWGRASGQRGGRRQAAWEVCVCVPRGGMGTLPLPTRQGAPAVQDPVASSINPASDAALAGLPGGVPAATHVCTAWSRAPGPRKVQQGAAAEAPVLAVHSPAPALARGLAVPRLHVRPRPRRQRRAWRGAGWTDRQLGWRVAGGRLERLHPRTPGCAVRAA